MNFGCFMATRQKKAVFFDLDGVIVSSEPHWVETESDFLRGLLSGWNEDNQSRLLGLSIKDVYRMLSTEFGLDLGWPEFLEFYDRRAKPIYSALADEVSGASRLIRELRSRGHLIAIVSNSPRRWIDMVVARFDLAPFLDRVISSDDVDAPGKPDPAIYLHALKATAVPAEAALAIEDSRKGVASAKAAGIRTIGLLNGYNKPEQLAAADLIVSGFSDPWWQTAD